MKKIILTIVIMFAMPAFAAAPRVYEVTIKDHVFSPAEIKVPANTAAILHVKNLDATPEEFESKKLRIEKIISGNSEAKIRLRPLEAGSYKFEGEFNSKTARGVIIAE